MKEFQTKRRVAHSVQDMFDLVADIESYPAFVPLCQGLRLKGRERDGDKDILIADMTVAYKLFRETFASRVTLDRQHSSILVEYLDGPFRHLENRWNFRPAGEGSCDVEFYLAYEFGNLPMQLMMGAMFDQAFSRFAQAFEERADEIYGRKDQPGDPVVSA